MTPDSQQIAANTPNEPVPAGALRGVKPGAGTPHPWEPRGEARRGDPSPVKAVTRVAGRGPVGLRVAGAAARGCRLGGSARCARFG